MTTPPPGTVEAPDGAGAAWASLAAGFAPVLAQAAGDGARLASFSLDLADAPDGAPPVFTARLDRGGRTLAFVSGEARRPDGALVAAATAVFRRGKPSPST